MARPAGSDSDTDDTPDDGPGEVVATLDAMGRSLETRHDTGKTVKLTHKVAGTVVHVAPEVAKGMERMGYSRSGK
jgi:hypothetical protein